MRGRVTLCILSSIEPVRNISPAAPPTLTHAGTSWYHPHFDTARQVDLGLYGALVVTDPDEPAVDRDLVVIADAWGEHDARTPPEGDNHHGLDGAGMTWTFNGAIDPVLDVEPGERWGQVDLGRVSQG